MKYQPKTRHVLHDLQSRCASLKSASKLLDECPAEKAQEMLGLMTQEARLILRCLFQLQKDISAG